MLSFSNNKNGKYSIICKNTGKLILEKNYLNNLLHGEYVYYWDNGQIRFMGMFIENKRVGTWLNYDKQGNIIFKESYIWFLEFLFLIYKKRDEYNSSLF